MSAKNVDRSMLEMCRFPAYPTPGLPSVIQNVKQSYSRDFGFEFADVPIYYSERSIATTEATDMTLLAEASRLPYLLYHYNQFATKVAIPEFGTATNAALSVDKMLTSPLIFQEGLQQQSLSTLLA